MFIDTAPLATDQYVAPKLAWVMRVSLERDVPESGARVSGRIISCVFCATMRATSSPLASSSSYSTSM